MQCRCGLAMRILLVRPSVCPPVKCVHCDKTEERSVQIFIPYKRSFSLVFSEEEWLLRGDPSIWNFGSACPRWSEIADFQPIFACSASPITPSEKVQLTLIGSTLRAFQRAYDGHRTLLLSLIHISEPTRRTPISYRFGVIEAYC